jgi:ribosomal-protein-alanine N-acetyltransferase
MSGYARVSLEHAEVKGERVYLRPITKLDARACYDLVHGVSAITDWTEWDGPENLEEVEGHYSEWPLEGEELSNYTFAIIEVSSGDWAGSISLRHRKGDPVAGLGYLVGVPYQGRGLCSEAVRLVVQLAFEALEVLLVEAELFAENGASQRILEKVGMCRDERGDELYEKRGVERLSHLYSLSRVTWELAAERESVWEFRSSRAD